MHLNRKSIIFCGHLLDRNGISCDSREVEAILKMPTPTDKAAVMRIRGMNTYLSKFCPQFSDITEKLRTLIRKENNLSGVQMFMEKLLKS